MNRFHTLSFAVLALIAGPALAQQQDFSKVQEVVTTLGHNMFEITGAGGNTTIAVGSDSVIVVDTQFAPLYDKLKAKIAEFSGGKPVKYVINTHYHPDHIGGNAAFAKDGAIIVAHENVGKRMGNPPLSPTGALYATAPTEAMPARLYSGDGTTLTAGGVTAKLVHPAPAHTDGDTFVVWRAADVISTGDIVGSAVYPNIDVNAGGGIDGMIAGATWVIDHCDAATKVVPGHGPVTNKAGVIAYRGMLRTARDRIAKAKGMTEQQVVDAHLLSDLDPRWNAPGNPMAQRFPINVYRSIK